MKQTVFRLLAALPVALASQQIEAKVTEIVIEETVPYADGHTFGDVGEYVRIKGKAKGELDPSLPENAVITDIDRVARNADGMVAYETEFLILKPKDPAKTRGIMLYDVTNRGRPFLLQWVNDAKDATQAELNDPTGMKEAGNGFSFKRGYTMVWSGWDPDVPKANKAIGMNAPIVMENGAPLVRTIRVELVAGTRGPNDIETMKLSYPTANRDKSKAKLTVRAEEGDERTAVPETGWEYASDNEIRLLPAGTKFAPRKIYDFWYPATNAKAGGVGFAATRDLIAYFRSGAPDAKGTINPAGPIKHTMAIGISQSGRFLRQFIELGMNKDESGQRVFDGIYAHIAGAGKVFDNLTFAEPGRTSTQHEDHFFPENWFPFSQVTLTDPLSGRTAGLAESLAGAKLIETNTSTEYWQKGASLLHTDPMGRRDLTLPQDTRVYLVAGTQHGGRAGTPGTPGACANPRNSHSAGPALRAMTVALEEWVVDGKAAPESLIPRIADKTAIKPERVVFPSMKGAVWPSRGNAIGLPVDWNNPPPMVSKAYGSLVSAVDSDGNEVSGIRLPSIAVPLGTLTGINVYKDYPEELCDRDGLYLPFAKTKADREAAGDPRPSLVERYGNRDAYAKQVRETATDLVGKRLLLPEDADALSQAALNVAPF